MDEELLKISKLYNNWITEITDQSDFDKKSDDKIQILIKSCLKFLKYLMDWIEFLAFLCSKTKITDVPTHIYLINMVLTKQRKTIDCLPRIISDKLNQITK